MTSMVASEMTEKVISPRIRMSEQSDRRRLAALIHLEPYVHQHPGWYAPLEKIGEPGFVVSQAPDGALNAALAVLQETPRVAWVRLFATVAALPPAEAWETLWSAAIAPLRERGVRWVAVMPFADWFRRVVQEHGFHWVGDVEVMAWHNSPLPPHTPAKGLRLRAMMPQDLPVVAAIDVAAFGEFWQMSDDAFQTALAHSVWATVVEDETGRILGFQISTPTPLGGHLARLAVHPEAQRRGIGRWLVHDTLSFFKSNKAEQVTLNTQGQNAKALILYRRMGFRSTEEVYPVYRFVLSP